jgi:hypothetical protein
MMECYGCETYPGGDEVVGLEERTLLNVFYLLLTIISIHIDNLRIDWSLIEYTEFIKLIKFLLNSL